MSKRILVINLHRIGDFAILAPLLKALKDLEPACQLDLLVFPANFDWKECLSFEANFLGLRPYPLYESSVPRWLARLGFYLNYFITIVRLRSRRYDVAIDTNEAWGDWHMSLLMWISGIQVRVGSDRAKLKFLNTHTVSYPSGRIHRSKQMLSRFRAIWPGMKPADPKSVCRQDLRNTRRQKRILLHPGSFGKYKAWPIASWAELIILLNERLPEYEVQLVGTSSDDFIFHQICEKLCLERPVPVVHSPSLASTLRLQAESSVVVSVDSAAAHMAAIAGTPCVTIFSILHDDLEWGAIGNNVILPFDPGLTGPDSSSSGVHSFMKHLRQKPLSADAVYDAVVQQITSRGA